MPPVHETLGCFVLSARALIIYRNSFKTNGEILLKDAYDSETRYLMKYCSGLLIKEDNFTCFKIIENVQTLFF